MDGVFVYWFGWLAWIAGTFLLPKNELRQVMCASILALLCFIPLNVIISGNQISIGYVFSLLICYLQLGKLKFIGIMYPAVCCILVAATYIGIQELIRLDPVILLIDGRFLSAGAVLLTIFIIKRRANRTAALATGLLYGDLFLNVYRHGLNGGMELGSLAFFDVFAISVSMSTAALVFSVAMEKWRQYVLANNRQPKPVPTRIDKHA
ncbi:hypothetical protein Q5W88_08350 [Shouchella clausii]|uniref:YphA family membrane protein n=1 Tax=Shouchella clausii TaxID=79880 RepID=UPI0026F42D64|nr:hypothetical protein [Shouchella clausii]MDO7283128.1 hypothetical protein [Shouchella clausii]MDO7303225.1 hypothetical protein [Shouchella clausii]